MSSAPTFETVLPRLVATYEAGRLVPFIGSGMSQRTCTDWATFIRQLEHASGGKKAARLDSKTPREVLIRRANTAVRTLKRGAPGEFAKAVRAGLLTAGTDRRAIPPQTQSLAQLSWPLVLTTNYDNCYAAAFHGNPDHSRVRKLDVVGRSAEDCQRVLTSLSTPSSPLLWALQGYLHDVPHDKLASTVSPDLEAQLVVGHEEYRRVTYRDLHFRRAFAEVFRQRSLLFLGAGIQESYLQELFGEVLEFYGPATRPHYAFIKKGEVDPDFMLARFQIVVVEYPKGKHEVVQHRLDRLAEEVGRARRTAVAWSWGRVKRQKKNGWTSVPDFEVVRGPLPVKRGPGECLAVSAGGEVSEFFFSQGIEDVMQRWGSGWEMIRRTRNPYLGQDRDHHVYAVRARTRKDEYSLAAIYQASLALFRHLNGSYHCIRMQLIATGGEDKIGVSEERWLVRNYPARFSFIQTARAWAAWRKEEPKRNCRLVLHVVLESVYHDIASGRIDVLELLSCPDIRFFVEVVSAAGDVERRLFQAMPAVTLDSIVKDLQLKAAQWTFEVTPPPKPEGGPDDLTRKWLGQTLEELGILPGSTVHFRRCSAPHGTNSQSRPTRITRKTKRARSV